MSRFDELLTVVETYQLLAAENYNRIRRLAEDVRAGLCAYLGSADGVCVHLVPPDGPFEPRGYGDQAFSVPPRGFRPLGPVSFGLAVRVSTAQDWLRLVLQCRKTGESFRVQIGQGPEYDFRLPLRPEDADPFNAHIFDHIMDWFSENIESYREGSYGSRGIGFDFSRAPEAPDGLEEAG